MDYFLQLLEYVMCYLHILTAVLILFKAILAFKNRGGNVPAIVTSFFRFYSRSDFYMSTNKDRKEYMLTNNVINIYVYVWVFLTVIFFVVFHRFC